jgi:hypothetical protein
MLETMIGKHTKFFKGTHGKQNEEERAGGEIVKQKDRTHIECALSSIPFVIGP